MASTQARCPVNSVTVAALVHYSFKFSERLASAVTALIQRSIMELNIWASRIQVFFAQSMHIKLVLHQAAWLSIFFIRKCKVIHLHKGPDQECTTDGIERKKRPATGGIQTHNFSVMRRLLYHCGTTTVNFPI